jgi:hypothetical protein
MRTVPAAIPGRHLTDGKRDLAVRILSTQPATARARSPPLAGLEHGKYNIAAIGQRPFIIPLHFSSIPTETRYHKWARLRTLTSGQGSERSHVRRCATDDLAVGEQHTVLPQQSVSSPFTALIRRWSGLRLRPEQSVGPRSFHPTTPEAANYFRVCYEAPLLVYTTNPPAWQAARGLQRPELLVYLDCASPLYTENLQKHVIVGEVAPITYSKYASDENCIFSVDQVQTTRRAAFTVENSFGPCVPPD